MRETSFHDVMMMTFRITIMLGCMLKASKVCNAINYKKIFKSLMLTPWLKYKVTICVLK